MGEADANNAQAYKNSGVRGWIESKFGIGKIAYGLRHVMAKLQKTSETVINLAFLAMNLVRKLLCAVFTYINVSWMGERYRNSLQNLLEWNDQRPQSKSRRLFLWNNW